MWLGSLGALSELESDQRVSDRGEHIMNADIQVRDFANVAERCRTLDCDVPTKLAILPRNFETAATKDELVHESEAPTVRVLWRNAGLEETPIERDAEKFPQVSEKDFRGWVGPILFVGSLLVSQNLAAVDLALNVVANYLTDWFRGVPKDQRVAELKVAVEGSDGVHKLVHYKGPVEGMDRIGEIARELGQEKR